jgi:hypothetical protein
MDTDYNTFAAVYSCATVPGVGKFEYAWLLTRDRKPSRKVVRIFTVAYKLRKDAFETS